MGNNTWDSVIYEGRTIHIATDEGIDPSSPWLRIYLMGTFVLDGKETDLGATLGAGGRVVESMSINDSAPAFGASEAAWSEAVSISTWIAGEYCVMAQMGVTV